MLLALEAVHVRGQFGRGYHILEVDKLPALHLCPVAEVKVLGQRIMFPTTGIVNALLAPHAGCAVKIEEAPASASRRLLDGKVTVKEEGLDTGQDGVFLVDVPPARLDHPHLLVSKEMDHFMQHIRLRDKISIKDINVFTRRTLHAVLECPRLEACAVNPVDILNIEALFTQLGLLFPAEGSGFIRGVIKDLYLQQLLGIIKPGHSPNQAAHDV